MQDMREIEDASAEQKKLVEREEKKQLNRRINRLPGKLSAMAKRRKKNKVAKASRRRNQRA